MVAISTAATPSRRGHLQARERLVEPRASNPSVGDGKDRSVVERRDAIIRKVLDDMIALQRKGLGIVGAKLVARRTSAEREQEMGSPQAGHHARPAQMSEEITMASGTKSPGLGLLLVALGLSAASVGLTASPAQAERGHVSIGIGIPVAPAVPPPVVYAPPAYVAPPPVVYAPPAYVAPPPLVAYPAPVYGGVSLGFGWHDGGRHHWRR